MSVTITTIQPQDSIASSRLTLNSNFSALKAGIDAVQVLLDPTTSVLSGVKSATINDSAVSSSTTIFQVGKGSALLGNVIMGTVGATSSVLVNGNGGFTLDQASMTLTNGNLTMSGSTSLASLAGHFSLANELRLPGVATAFSSVIGLSSSTATNVSVTNKKYMIIRNDGIVSGLTASLSSGTSGQVLEIFHILGPSAFPVYIDTTNFYGLTGGISMSKTGDTVKCVYDGSSWYMWNYSAASFGATAGATASSIRFTTT
jgi:hypothetical protein